MLTKHNVSRETTTVVLTDYPTPLSQNDTENHSEHYISEEKYNDSIGQSAYKQILALTKGNGITSKHIKIKDITGQNALIYGILHFKLQPEITRNDVAGRAPSGDIISSGTLNAKIDQFCEELIYQDHLSETLIRDISNSPTKGFGLNNTAVNLPVEKTFIEEDKCGHCQGQGRSVCGTCQGQQQMNCQKCSGSRYSPCMMCRGVGRSQTAGSQQDMCTYCQGRGQISCDLCRGSGRVACTTCGATGHIQCRPCNASGTISHISNVKITLIPQFEKMQKSLIKGFSILHDYSAEELVLNKIVEPHIIEDKDIEQLTKEGVITPPERGDYLYLAYKAVFPHAQIQLSLGPKRTIDLSVAGYKPEIVKCDPFLDLILAKPFKLLRKAANNSTTASQNVQKAIKWRTIRAAFSINIQNGPRKGLPILQKMFPHGLSEKMAKALCINSYKALKNITRTPRYIALGLTSITSLFAYKLWFDNFKATLLNDIHIGIDPVVMSAMADSLTIFLLVFLSVIAIKLSGFFALKRMFKTIGLSDTKIGLPKAGKPSVIGGLLQPVLFLVTIFTLINEKPEWLSYLGL